MLILKQLFTDLLTWREQQRTPLIGFLPCRGNSSVLRSLAFFLVEVCQSSALAKAEGFTFTVAPPSEVLLSEHRQSYWWVLVKDTWSSMKSLTRLMWLMLIFGPVIFSSPLALQYNLYRDEWMELLRVTLHTAGPAFIK
eukprot:gene2142-18191_t